MISAIFLLVSISLFVYQVMTAFMDMGTSDEFRFENITLADIIDDSTVEWIDGISQFYIQSVAETLITMPLAILMFAGAVLLFLIHAFTGEKRMRKT